MTQEDKELLLKDLCTRSSYGLICSIYQIDDWNVGWRDEKLTGYFMIGAGYEFYFGEFPVSIDNIFKIKPYLRPMSSMTEEEKEEFGRLVSLFAFTEVNDWLNARHLDYRGLIEKGLAIEVTADNNPYKE